jgi:hypothetical protein
MFRMTATADLRWFFAILLVLTCASCNRDLPRSRFVGTYEAQHERGIETLTLDSDGTYKHYFRGEFGMEVTAAGRWEVARVGSKQRVLVHDFTPHFPGRPDVASNYPLEPHEDYGLLRLYVSHQPRQFYLELPQKQ